MDPIELQWPPRVAITPEDDIELDLPFTTDTDRRWQEHFADAFEIDQGSHTMEFIRPDLLRVAGMTGDATPRVISAVLAALTAANQARLAERAPVEAQSLAVVEAIKGCWKSS